MRNTIGTLVMLILALLPLPDTVEGQRWTSFTSKDDMTGELQAYATSPRTGATQPLDFPYRGVKGWLGFGCDGQDEWVYVGFTEDPNLTNTTPQDGGYSTFQTRIRWDDNVQTVRMSQEWGGRFLNFRSDASIVASMVGAQSVLLELQWYGSGKTYFNFSLNGSADAIANARRACN